MSRLPAFRSPSPSTGDGLRAACWIAAALVLGTAVNCLALARILAGGEAFPF